MNTTATYAADPAHPDPADSRNTSIGRETAAGPRPHRLIRRIRRRRLVCSKLLASILIAAVTPISQGNPVIMRSAAGRE
jgi:hypothetical protein